MYKENISPCSQETYTYIYKYLSFGFYITFSYIGIQISFGK